MSSVAMKQASVDDYSDVVDRLSRQNRSFIADVSLLKRTIDKKDGMLSEDAEYYFLTGRSAVDIIDTAIRWSSFRNKSHVGSVLDFACGYGRVLRWLKAYFPHARVLGVDVDKNAVASVTQVLEAEARVIDHAWSNVPDETFDLIWMGSLLTHLSESRCTELMRMLRSRLTHNGLLVATMHGDYVAGRMRSGEKTYGLSQAGIAHVLSGYDEDGFGFSEYEGMRDYGISINRLAKMETICLNAGLAPKLFIERGWVSHQDVMACVPDAR